MLCLGCLLKNDCWPTLSCALRCLKLIVSERCNAYEDSFLEFLSSNNFTSFNHFQFFSTIWYHFGELWELFQSYLGAIFRIFMVYFGLWYHFGEFWELFESYLGAIFRIFMVYFGHFRNICHLNARKKALK